MARIGEELEVVNEWIFDSRGAAIEAAREEPEWVLVEYVELKLLAAKYLESKVLWPRVEGVVADVLADAENRAAPMGHFVGKEYEL